VSFLLSLLPFAMVNIGQAAWAPSIRHGFLPGKVLAKAGTVQTKALGNEKRATCELEQSQFQLRQMFKSGQRVPVSDVDEMKLLNMVGEHHIHAHQATVPTSSQMCWVAENSGPTSTSRRRNRTAA